MNAMNTRSGCNCSENKESNYRNSMNSRASMNDRSGMNCRCNMSSRGDMNYGGDRNRQGGCSQGRCGMSNEEMERVMQRCENDSAQRGCDSLYGMHLAMGYVPWQEWGKTYEPAEGIGCGTIFPELNLPFLGCVPRDCGCGARRGGRA